MSSLQDQELYYDYDRDIANRSPPLQAIKPNLQSKDSPEPLVRLIPSSDSSEVEDTHGVPSSRKPRKKRKGRTNPSFADGVLIRSLDSSQVELAAHVERNALESASQSEAEEEDNEADGQAARRQMSRSGAVVQSQPTQVATRPRDIAEAALIAISRDRDKDDDWPMIDTPASVAGDKSPRSPSNAFDKPRDLRRWAQGPVSVPPRLEDPPKKRLNVVPPPLNPRPSQEYEDDEDSIIKSPALAKFAIARDDAPPDSILPAFQQRSPARSSPAGSPHHRQTLPNLKTAIGNIRDSSFAAFANMSPIGRPSPGYLGPFASPASYSAMSPPPPRGPPSHFIWGAPSRDSKTSTSSNYTSSSATVSTPTSSTNMPSPAPSQPPCLVAVPEQDTDPPRGESPEDSDTQFDSESQTEPHADDPSSSRFLAGNYRCTYHGCNAVPFQTQYLLNSHMNVHSNNRTHFCPVDGCTRGPGGQGFKRKNEMIRHGLVHTSPGYICPFCPDQQHKYPRPDNLQRHVRQHHMDRDRDDPVLRDVLNQRMEGGSRGGRRRMRL